jgi:ligand-binding SRPBCC domain-containing protein
MIIHTLDYEQTIRTGMEECWRFFSSAQNLSVITPPELDFKILSPLPKEIYSGLMIRYRVRPLMGIPLIWVTEITHARGPYYFCDEQRVGPYRLWHHEHFFEELPGGMVRVRDLIHYALPFSPPSEIVHPLLVAPQLRRIFAYRRQKLAALFPGQA